MKSFILPLLVCFGLIHQSANAITVTINEAVTDADTLLFDVNWDAGILLIPVTATRTFAGSTVSATDFDVDIVFHVTGVFVDPEIVLGLDGFDHGPATAPSGFHGTSYELINGGLGFRALYGVLPTPIPDGGSIGCLFYVTVCTATIGRLVFKRTRG